MTPTDDFPTTRWSVVRAAVDAPTTQTRRALAELCEDYWRPLFAYIRRRGYSTDDAGDLVQAFFAELLEKRFVDAARPEGGRFRAFLLHTLKCFLTDEHRKANALKRGGGLEAVRLDLEEGDRLVASISSGATPEVAYDQLWATSVVDQVVERMRGEAVQAGQQAEFEAMQPFLTEDVPRGGIQDAARALGKSEATVRVAVHRLRKRFGQTLRETIAETVDDPQSVEAEIRHLFASLSA